MSPIRLAATTAVAALLAVSLSGAAAQNRLAGLGDHPGVPSGTPYSLPPGLELIEIKGMGDEGCRTPDGVKNLGQFGAGRAGFCMRLSNGTGAPIDLNLPEGLMVLAQGDEFQNGMLVGIVPITITTESGGPGGTKICPGEQVLLALAAYCLNHSRAFPEPGGKFTLGSVTALPELRAIADAVKGKDIRALDEAIQQYLDDFGAGDADRADLQNLLAEIAAQPDLPTAPDHRCQPTA